MTEPTGQTDLERASSPDTSADDLGKLAFSNDAFVVDAVLANPNTPTWAVRRVRSSRGLDPDSGDKATTKTSDRIRRGPLVTTTPTIPGYDIVDVLGLVSATSSNVALGLNRQATRLDKAVAGAANSLIAEARQMGANAVIGLTLAINSSEGGSAAFGGSSEGAVLLGTAVFVKPSGHDAVTKTCPVCQEVIHARAAKCPHCAEWLHSEESD